MTNFFSLSSTLSYRFLPVYSLFSHVYDKVTEILPKTFGRHNNDKTAVM